MREQLSQKIFYMDRDMKLLKYIQFSFFLILTSCSLVTSSYHYTKGTQHLEQGNYEEAICELQKAVDLEPDFARNHLNLCAAYLNVGDYDKAWFHSRQSRICKYDDGLSEIQFVHLCDRFIHQAELDKPGTSYEKVISILGEPDVTIQPLVSNKKIIIYGTYVMVFENDKLTLTELCHSFN